MIGDFIISLSRKVSDKISGTGRWFVIKNRFGQDGITLPSKLNMANGQIQIFDGSSLVGKEVNQTMQNSDTILRQTLASKFKDMQSNSLG
jgi:hypothetical protein